MKIGLLFFGVLKDVVGRPAETVDLPEGSRVRDLVLHVRGLAPLEPMLPSLAIAVNREYADPDRTLRDGDEVALLPPVSGGSAGTGENPNPAPNEPDSPGDIRIVRQPIDTEEIIKRLPQAPDGALVIFNGVVRDNSRGRRTLYLDYEAYEPMALRQMKSLAIEARTRFAVRGVSIIHRLGRLEIGETSVLIAVAAAHRGPAFDACRSIIDTLKKTVPIWKKEYFADGAIWADGERFPEEIPRIGGSAGERAAS